MRWFAAGLTFVNGFVITALLAGMAGGGLGRAAAWLSLLAGMIAGCCAFFTTRQSEDEIAGETTVRAHGQLYTIGFWALAAVFAFFVFRSFGWILYIDGDQLKIQSPNNLGDLPLHITYARTFANGVPLWPDNPIHVFSKIRYPAGTDLFNGLLLILGIDLIRGLVWAGVLGSLATFYALYRWGGLFTVAGFLFNGGIAGALVLTTGSWIDYQGVPSIAWKSLALSMLVTQRGLLYALPAGLLLLYQWRALFDRFAAPLGRGQKDVPDQRARQPWQTPPLPIWVETSLYATMPFFHVHTFIALSFVAAILFILGTAAVRRHLAIVVGISFLPATFIVWTITDHFQARSLLKFQPGWVQHTGEFAAPFLQFWWVNFGFWIPLVLLLLGACIWRAWKRRGKIPLHRDPNLVWLIPAAFLFLFACLVKTAPWEWDNIKLIIWAYLIMLPILWSALIGRWPGPVQVGVCVALFFSGFATLFGGLAVRDGYGIVSRAELDGVGSAVRQIPATARFAAYPTYNHPLLLQGRPLVLGYPGHLWTQGFEFQPIMQQLESIMRGDPGWRDTASRLGARYLFWGEHERRNYPTSTRPWERDARLVASGAWGAIYDLQGNAPLPTLTRPPRP